MLSFVPFHLSALETSKTLRPWLSQWLGEDMELLAPKE